MGKWPSGIGQFRHGGRVLPLDESVYFSDRPRLAQHAGRARNPDRFAVLMQSPAVRPHTQGTCHSTICHLRAASGSQLPSLARRPAARCLLPLAALVPLLISGCGRSVPLGQVDGTVRLDGQPIGQVMVVFIPEDPRLPQSMGITDERGQFKLRCGKQGAGGAIGNHRVTLVDAAAAPATKGRDEEPPEGARLLPRAASRRSTTGRIVRRCARQSPPVRRQSRSKSNRRRNRPDTAAAPTIRPVLTPSSK